MRIACRNVVAFTKYCHLWYRMEHKIERLEQGLTGRV
jgi:hypothetical protein